MGHGTRESYGYSREMENESFVVGELSKLWSANIAATSRDLEERDGKIEQLRSELTQMREEQKLLDRMLRETTGYGVIKDTYTKTGKPAPGIGIYLADRKKLEELAKTQKKAVGKKRSRPFFRIDYPKWRLSREHQGITQ